MQDLIKIENRVINNDYVQTVNARDLYNFLELKKDFSDWFKQQIIRADLLENIDFITSYFLGENPLGGRPSKEYYITLDVGKNLAMMSNTQKGKDVRRYFIEAEKALMEYRRNMKKSDLYLLLAEEEIAKEKALEEIERLKPFEEKVNNSKVIFSKKEPVYDEEKGFKKNVKDVYPFLSNAHISLILEHYTTKRYKDTDHYIKSELDCVSTFFTEADMKVSTTKDTVIIKHPCLLGNRITVRKDKAIEYLDYTEEEFE